MSTKREFSIPERLYYPISEAAKKLNCSTSDVIHMGATGVFTFSIYIPLWQEKESERFNVFTLNIEGLESHGFLRGKGWSVSEIYHEDLEGINDGKVSFAKSINGFFNLSPVNLIELEFNSDAEFFKVNSLNVRVDDTEVDEILIHSFYGVSLPVKNLCVMASELNSLNFKKGQIQNPESDKKIESPKTSAKKGELIIQLLKLMPDFRDVNLDAIPVAKIISLVEAAAAENGIEMPKTDKQTWARYLGRK